MAYGTIKADKLITTDGEIDLTSVIAPGEATQTDPGLMSAADKTKLDGVEAGAEVNTVTSVNGETGAVTVQGFSGDYSDLTNKPAIGDGTITLQSYGQNAAADSTFSANQGSNQTITLPQVRYEDVSGTPDLSTKADLIGGELDPSQLPPIAVSEYKGAVADETAMLAVSGEKGDWVSRNDDGKVYVITGDDPTSASDWTALNYPVGFSGAYSDLTGKPTLGTAAATDSTDYATASQGALADSSVQPGDLAGRAFTADGSISAGDPVVLNSDGTASSVGQVVITNPSFLNRALLPDNQVSTNHTLNWHNDQNSYSFKSVLVWYSRGTQAIVQEVTSDSTGALSMGNGYLFRNDSAITFTSSVYDSASERSLCIYKADDKLSYTQFYYRTNGTGGQPIGFNGSQQTISSSENPGDTACCFDTNRGRVVVAYSDANNSNQGYIRSGVYNGSNEYDWSSAYNFSTGSVDHMSICYDETQQKCLIVFQDGSNASVLKAIVATVASDGSISFGSEFVCSTNFSQYASIVHDPSSGQNVLFFLQFDGGGKGACRTLSISGTTVTAGAELLLPSAYPKFNTGAYDSTNQVVSFVYIDGYDNQRSTIVSVKVSGTDVNVGTPLAISAATANIPGIAFYGEQDQMITAYQDYSNNLYGQVESFNAVTLVSNLTTDSFIGFAPGAFNDGESGSLSLIGDINSNQSSLTAGRYYFVQGDGSLGTEADSVSVFAGTAISASEIIVQAERANPATSIYTETGITSTSLVWDAPTIENVYIDGTTDAFASATNVDIANGNVHYFTDAESAADVNTVNIRWDGSNSLDSKLSVGQSISTTLILASTDMTRAPSAIATVQIDGSTVTPLWQGNSAAPEDDAGGTTSGDNEDHDVYSLTIIKTGSATFTVLAARVRYGLVPD